MSPEVAELHRLRGELHRLRGELLVRDNQLAELRAELEPRPIASAPRDGTTVLTDRGPCQYVDPRNWGCPIAEGWASCDNRGDLFSCADDGYFYVSPTLFLPLPGWMQ